MTFNPTVPVWLLALLGLLLVGLCVFCLVTSPGQRVRWGLRIALICVLCAAATRPGIPYTVEGTKQVGDADVFIMVDTTASMIAEDWAGKRPRIEGVRNDVKELAKNMPGARFSLITFDSEAELRMPLTTDTSALNSAMEVMSPELTIGSSGSSITVASELLDERLEKAHEKTPRSKRYVFYFGDGEQTAKAQVDAITKKGNLITGGAVFGYGTQAGGRMKETQFDYDLGGSKRPDKYIEDKTTGAPAVSRINEGNLKKISGQLDAKYVKRSATIPLATAYAPPKVAEVKSEAAMKIGAVHEYFWIFLILAFALLTVEVCLVGSRIRLLLGVKQS